MIQEILSKKNLKKYGYQGLIKKNNSGVVTVSKTIRGGGILDYYILNRLSAFGQISTITCFFVGFDYNSSY